MHLVYINAKVISCNREIHCGLKSTPGWLLIFFSLTKKIQIIFVTVNKHAEKV